MMHLIIIICGLFSLCVTIFIDAIRIANRLYANGEEIPTDRLELAKLWIRYFNDEL